MIPDTLADAVRQLGWEIVGQPRIHPEGAVYLCRDQTGVTEPYSERAILLELARMRRFFSLALQAGGAPEEQAIAVAPTLSLAIPVDRFSPSSSRRLEEVQMGDEA